jgi:Mrp family chromosome partitioning ATPase
MTEDQSPAMAEIPYATNRQAALVPDDCDPRIVFLHDQHSPSAEEYRRIVSRLVSDHPKGGTLMVTSPTPGDGKTLTSINLALCMAERTPTLLMDLDTRHSSVRRRLGIEPTGPGVEDALLEVTHPDGCVLTIPDTRLSTCINRGDGQAVIDLMSHGRPKRFLDWASKRFTWVIIDTPPAFPIADTLEIANHAPIGMLVIRARKTPTRLAKKTIDALRGHIHYVMFNDSEAPRYAGYNPKCYFGTEPEDRRQK